MALTRLLGGGALRAALSAGLDRHSKPERVTVQKSLTVGTWKPTLAQTLIAVVSSAPPSQRQAIAAIRIPDPGFSLAWPARRI